MKRLNLRTCITTISCVFLLGAFAEVLEARRGGGRGGRGGGGRVGPRPQPGTSRPSPRPPRNVTRPAPRPNPGRNPHVRPSRPGQRPGQKPHRYLPGRSVRKPGVSPRRPVRVQHSRTVLRRHRTNFRSDWYRLHPRARAYWHVRHSPAAWARRAWRWSTTFYLCSWLGRPTYYDYDESGYAYVDQSQTTVYYGDDDASSAAYQDGYVEVDEVASRGDIDVGSPEEDQLKNGEWASIGIYGLVPLNQDEPAAMLQLAVSKEGLVSGNYVDLDSGESYGVKGAVDPDTMKLAIRADVEDSGTLETTMDMLSQPDSIAQLYLKSGSVVSVNLVKAENEESDES